MKKILITTLALYCTFLAFGQKVVNTKITEVTVALNGAQVFRQGKIYYNRGITKVLIDDVSPNSNANGLQATSMGNYRVMDIKKIIKYPEPVATKPTIVPLHINKEIETLNDSMFATQLRKEGIQMKMNVIKKQKRIIDENKLVKGTGKSDTLPILRELVDYYQEKMFELEDQLVNYQKEYRLIDNARAKMTDRLRELNNFSVNTNQPRPAQKTVHQLEVTIYSEQAGSSNLEVNYLVSSAGWIPAFDLRVKDTDQDMTFTYKAHVYQSTHENWKNVKLNLVTYDSRISNKKPDLPAWILQYYRAEFKKKKAYRTNTLSNIRLEEEESISEDMSYGEDKILEASPQEALTYVWEKTQVSSSLSNYTFNIALPYTIPSDGESVLILVSDTQIKADFKHYLVPKLSTKAYLQASVDNWEELNILQGSANLYFNKTYLGATQLYPETMDDTMNIDLGVDRSIICTRKKIKDKEKNQILGSKRKQEITIEIAVKNNKNSSINLSVEDQIPITKDETIEIELINRGKAELNPDTGSLTWDISLKANESRIFKFTYTIKSDKKRKLI